MINLDGSWVGGQKAEAFCGDRDRPLFMVTASSVAFSARPHHPPNPPRTSFGKWWHSPFLFLFLFGASCDEHDPQALKTSDSIWCRIIPPDDSWQGDPAPTTASHVGCLRRYVVIIPELRVGINNGDKHRSGTTFRSRCNGGGQGRHCCRPHFY